MLPGGVAVKIYDITRPLQASLAVWPGDTPYEFALVSRISAGETVNVGAVTMSVHAGTHADAPFHFQEGGPTMDAMMLPPYIGPALVMDAQGKERIRREDIPAARLRRAPRLLLKTNAWADPTRFPDWIPTLEADVAEYLGELGVLLVGVDVPSVDRLDSQELPVHHALAANGIAILESLWLAEAPAGEYELLALPLKLVGADGSPVRAILRA